VKRYLEDFEPGEVIEVGSHTFTKDEIVEFATRYDPQPFHVDEEAARKSHWGGLIASGWHTIGVLMRLTVETYIARAASLGSPGIDEIRFLRPVRPGDTIRGRTTILEVVPSRSKADRGHMLARTEGFNQQGELVISFVGRGIYFRRPASP
jgi:acyl dehydratase